MRRVLTIGWLLCATAVLAQKMSRDEVVALQIALDQAGFSPGTIDGKWGGQTEQALAAWQEASNLKPTGKFDDATAENFPAAGETYTNFTVTAEDRAQLGLIPEDWKARSQLTNMTFQTVREMVAEKFHAKEAFLRVLNPDETVAVWKVPNVTASRIPKAARLRVNLTAKTIRAYDATGKLIALFPCSIAANKAKRPVGTLTVQAVALNPNYTFDPVNFPELDAQQKAYGKMMIPPGSNNPVGAAWVGLSLTGYGMHGTPHPEDIGKTESHGCFRLANWNATRLAQMVEIGTPVEVITGEGEEPVPAKAVPR